MKNENDTIFNAAEAKRICEICRESAAPKESKLVRSNVTKFRNKVFLVWRCKGCNSLNCESVDNIADYYIDYPVRQQKLNYFLNRWLNVVLRRLMNAGLTKASTLLDYGCGHGVFIDFMKKKGYTNCSGYDPYAEKYQDTNVLKKEYEYLVSLDVIEHVDDPSNFMATVSSLLKPGGLLCIETPNADGIDLSKTERFIHAIHAPFHMHIMSLDALATIAHEHGFAIETVYHRWYIDHWLPLTSRRFIEAFMHTHGNDLDAAFNPPKINIFLRNPHLWFLALFGYFLPTPRDQMMVIFRKKQ